MLDATGRIGEGRAESAAPSVSETALLQARYDGQIPFEKWRAAETRDRNRLAVRQARQRRLAHIYDHADRRAIGTTNLHRLASATLAHWLYIRGTKGTPYPWPKMADDYRLSVLDRAGLNPSDIAALPPHSRPQIARRALIAAYATYRMERERRRVDLFEYGALGLAAE